MNLLDYFTFSELVDVIDKETSYCWRIVFVDDGSTDDTSQVLTDIVNMDARSEAVLFTRNFGKEAALSAGIKQLEDVQAVICIDADLQHPPTLIPKLLEEWQNGWPIVATVRRSVESHSKIRMLGSFCFTS